MLVASLVSAGFMVVLLVLVAPRLFGRGDVPYFTPRRRVSTPDAALAPATVPVAAPRSSGAVRAALVRSRRSRR